MKTIKTSETNKPVIEALYKQALINEFGAPSKCQHLFDLGNELNAYCGNAKSFEEFAQLTLSPFFQTLTLNSQTIDWFNIWQNHLSKFYICAENNTDGLLYFFKHPYNYRNLLSLLETLINFN